MQDSYSVKLSQRKKQILFVLLLLILALSSALAQSNQFKTEALQKQKLKSNLHNYIRQYSQEAINQMVEFKIPASVILAQAIFESGSGTSELAKSSNNHFGIKCQGVWIGDTIIRNDDVENECFRKYEQVEDSYRDHSLFLISRKRYASLFNYSSSDYKAWCYGLKKVGYATYPNYAEDLIRIIEDEKLYELDRTLNLTPIIAFKNIKRQNLPDIKLSKYNPKLYELKDYGKEGLIWLNEKDVLVQSIEMVLKSSDGSAMAGNP